ncbi:hypothetical protein F5Y15DRAFT_83892 [Xylariaceae sp. FL0016]|nr:hypothetical protein F5Y15DRAFT_83892 [Xylariaceae sp. FL0016]
MGAYSKPVELYGDFIYELPRTPMPSELTQTPPDDLVACCCPLDTISPSADLRLSGSHSGDEPSGDCEQITTQESPHEKAASPGMLEAGVTISQETPGVEIKGKNADKTRADSFKSESWWPQNRDLKFRRRMALSFTAIGDALCNPSASRFNAFDFKAGKSVHFPEIPGETCRNRNLPSETYAKRQQYECNERNASSAYGKPQSEPIYPSRGKLELPCSQREPTQLRRASPSMQESSLTRDSCDFSSYDSKDPAHGEGPSTHLGSPDPESSMNQKTQQGQRESQYSFSHASTTTGYLSMESSNISEDVPILDEEHPLFSLKQPVLEALMTAFESCNTRTHTNGDRASQAHNQTGITCSSNINGNRAKRGRGLDHDRWNSGRKDQEDDDGSDPKRTRRGDLPEPRRPRLACPFYKKDPMRYGTCHGKVISSIAHLKQHFRRHHQLPLYCPVCKVTFEDESTRDAHAMDRSCELRTDVIHDGITASHSKLLSKRASTALDEEGQWFAIFDILFPGFHPRPKTPYINAEVSAEMENFQDFMYLFGPDIIHDAMIKGGLEICSNGLHETDDLETLIKIGLANGLQTIGDQWNERNLSGQPAQPAQSAPQEGENEPFPTQSKAQLQASHTIPEAAAFGRPTTASPQLCHVMSNTGTANPGDAFGDIAHSTTSSDWQQGVSHFTLPIGKPPSPSRQTLADAHFKGPFTGAGAPGLGNNSQMDLSSPFDPEVLDFDNHDWRTF